MRINDMYLMDWKRCENSENVCNISLNETKKKKTNQQPKEYPTFGTIDIIYFFVMVKWKNNNFCCFTLCHLKNTIHVHRVFENNMLMRFLFKRAFRYHVFYWTSSPFLRDSIVLTNLTFEMMLVSCNLICFSSKPA